MGPGLYLEARSRHSGDYSEVRIEIGLPDGFAETWQSSWDEEKMRLKFGAMEIALKKSKNMADYLKNNNPNRK